MSSVFEKVVEPGLERVPVLEVIHTEAHLGREYRVHQTVSRNIFSEFDRKLSRHLAATSGAGFPAFNVAVDVIAPGMGGRRQLASASHSSVPHALLEIAKRAYDRSGPVELTFLHGTSQSGEHEALGPSRKVGPDDIDMLGAALKICRTLGEAEFLEISGDFDIVIVAPPGGLKPVVMHLQNGTVTIPSPHGGSDAPFESPIFGFTTHASQDLTAQDYLARARHALVAEKAAAIAEFRLAAEQRILAVDDALDGRPLTEHRLIAVEGLVERLRAGLGGNLKGLSEDAMITALDWSANLGSCVDTVVVRAASG